MKYIFVAGAPGSKWSSVVKNIYRSADIDQSDDQPHRNYAHNGQIMHVGAYWDPGMEFGTWFDRLDQHDHDQCEAEFDRPFSAQGVRIIKSHMFMYHIDFLRRHWPDCPIVLVHRGDDASLGWWVRCGGFDIAYPNYTKYYKTLPFMADEIARQNTAMRPHWEHAEQVMDNITLCQRLGIQPPGPEYRQIYADHKMRVKVY